MEQVAAFTDTYLPTINGVSYTVREWRDRWLSRGGRMDVVYPAAPDHDPGPGEHPVRSVPFPFYDGFRLGTPQVPRSVRDVDLAHAHTPFTLGAAAWRLARRENLPLVASYHTPSAEYAEYLAPSRAFVGPIRRASRGYERRFFERTDLVLAPSSSTADHIRKTVGIETPVEVVPNGVDTDRFRPVDPAEFRATHDLGDGPIVGYTGRHGYEKRLGDLVDAAAGLDATVLFGGDGPARLDLEARARNRDGDVRFLGFLDREALPSFYSALDVFVFPSPVETQGIVALEANACGTPVVGADAGALAETVRDGETGYRFPVGDVEAMTAATERALAERTRLSKACLDRRETISVERTIDQLDDLYDSVADPSR